MKKLIIIAAMTGIFVSGTSFAQISYNLVINNLSSYKAQLALNTGNSKCFSNKSATISPNSSVTLGVTYGCEGATNEPNYSWAAEDITLYDTNGVALGTGQIKINLASSTYCADYTLSNWPISQTVMITPTMTNPLGVNYGYGNKTITVTLCNATDTNPQCKTPAFNASSCGG